MSDETPESATPSVRQVLARLGVGQLGELRFDLRRRRRPPRCRGASRRTRGRRRTWGDSLPAVASSLSATLQAKSVGFMVRRKKRRATSFSSAERGAVKARLPASRWARSFSATASDSFASLSPPRASFSALSRARVTASRSESTSSVWIVSMSATGSSAPATWTMSLSSKQRTTSTIASTSRMCWRNLLPRPSPLDAPLTRPGDVHELDRGRDDALGLRDLRQRLEARVGHGDDADVRLDRAERVVRRLGLARPRQGVEEGGFADVRQSDDSGAQHRAGEYIEEGDRVIRLF